MQELLTAFGIDWKLILAQSINLIIVIAGLTYFLYKPLMRVVSKREAVLKQGVKDAEAAKVAKDNIANERDGIIKTAHKDADDIVSRAEEEGKKERAEIVKQAQERAEATIKDASLQSEELKRQALRESEEEIARTAVLAAEKLIREK